MSDQVNKAFVQQYANNVAHLLQQKGSKLRDTVMTSTATGKAAKVVEQVGAVNAQKRTTRHADTPLISTPHDARWTFPVDYEWADLIDDQDKVRMLINPQSPYATNGAYAMGRAIDDEILGAFFGDAKTGENGSTTEAGSGVSTVAAGSSGKLEIGQLLEGKRILMANEVDLDNDTIYMAITAAQHEDLLTMTQIQTIDSNSTKVLVDGRVRSFLGINFVTTERIPNVGDPTPCPMWAKSGMHLCVWNDITTKIEERADKSFATQVYCKGTFGATRVELGKVVKINADA